MAQVILTVVGSALGGPLGGAIGAALGAYLDSEFLFPPPDIEPPRTAGDQRTQGASEGMGLVYAIGPQVRVPGKIVYTGPRAIRVRDDGGVEEDVLIDLGQGLAGDGQYYNNFNSGWVTRVYANGQQIANITPDIDLSSTQIFAHLKVRTDYSQDGQSIDPTKTRFWLKLCSYDVNVDLSQLVEGKFVSVQAAWNLSLFDSTQWQLYSWAGDGYGIYPPTGSTRVLPADHPFVVEYGVPRELSSWASFYFQYEGEGPLTWMQNEADTLDEVFASNGDIVTRTAEWGSQLGVELVEVFQDLPQFDTNVVTSFKMYPGASVQAPEPIIDTDMGWVNERRGRAALVLSRLNKGKFGNTTPNFEVAYTHDPSMTVGEAVDALMQRHGVPRAYYDTSQLTDEFFGLVTEEPIDSLGLIQAMMLAYQFDCRETEGQLVFYRQDSRPVIEVPLEDLVLDGGGSTKVRGLRIEDQGDESMPGRVEVVYTDADRELMQSTARETHGELFGANRGQVKRVRTPLTLNQRQAGVMARELMLATYQSRQRFTATLPPKYLEVSEGDLLRFLGQQPFEGVVTRVEFGRNGQVKVQGYRRFRGLTGLTLAEVDVSDSAEDGSVIPVTPPVDPYQLDIMAQSASQALQPHMTFTLPYVDQAYPGVKVYYTTQVDADNLPAVDAQYIELPGFVDPSRWSGNMLVEGDGNGGVVYLYAEGPYFDRRSRLLVFARGYTPASCTYEEAMLGANRLVIEYEDGVEEIAYTTAELQSENTWLLTGLMRNLANNHQVAFPDPVVSLHARPDFVGTPYPFGTNAPQAYYLKGLPPGYDLEQVLPRLGRYRGGTARPLSPANIRYHWNSETDSVQLAWRRQVRQPWPIFSGAAPLDLPENYERYRVKVTDRDSGEVREYTVTDAAGDDGRVRFTLQKSMWSGALAWNGSFGFLFEVSQLGAYGESPAMPKVAFPGAKIGAADFPLV